MGPFSVSAATLATMNPHEAIEAFRNLLWAEAHAAGAHPISINVSGEVTTADGGIDATLDTTVALPKEGLLTSSPTRFQVKTGDSFAPWQASDVKKELFGKALPGNKLHLGAAVRACLDANGRYVVACFGHDLVTSQLDDARTLFVDHFKGCGYPTPNVVILGQNQLSGAFDRFPSLVRRYGGAGFDAILDHHSWSQDAEMMRILKLGPPQQDFIDGLRLALSGTDQRHIRVCGEPGIGKTRLVLEATRDQSLSPMVLYTTADTLRSSPLLTALISDTRLSVLLVIDECDVSAREFFSNRLTAHAKRIRLITLWHEYDGASGLNLLAPPVLTDAVVGAIIVSYGTPADIASQWARLCDGSPRVAHVIGQNLRTHPDDVLKAPSTSNVWERYVTGGRPLGGEYTRQVRTVLLHIALFQRFGYEDPVREEAKAIAALVQAIDPLLTWGRFQEIIRTLRDRRLLQGDRTLYITPRALHIWLWSEWWDTYGADFDIDRFVAQLKGELLQWFIEMWRYARTSDAAQRVVGRLLAPDGPFSDGKLLQTEIGSRFLLALTDASPEAALECLERTVGAWAHDALLAFTTGRRSVIFALERIVVWRQLFIRGARVLLRLASAENESWANNAVGVFADLFTPGHGKVAASEASPEERFPVLVEALQSSLSSSRAAGVKAVDHALQTDHFSRMVGAEYQGLRSPPEFWVPKTWGELFDAYRRVWEFVDAHLVECSDVDRGALVAVLVNRSRGLIHNPHLATMCLTTLRRLVYEKYATSKAVLHVLEDILHYDAKALSEEARAAATALRDDLIGSGLSARLHRYVGLNLLTDQFDEEGNRTDHWDRVLEALAEESLSAPAVLREELGWLSTRDAENAGTFGYRLGRRDTELAVLDDARAALARAGASQSAQFLAGYLRAVFERDPGLWEAELDRWITQPTLAHLLPEVTWRSGASDRAVDRMLLAARKYSINLWSFGYFRFGRAVEALSEPAMEQLATYLSERSELEAAALAVELLHDYYGRAKDAKPIPTELVKRVVTDARLFDEDAADPSGMAGYAWAQLAQLLVERAPESGPQLLEAIVANSRGGSGIIGRHDTDVDKLVRAIFASRPSEAWDVVAALLESSDNVQVFNTLSWISGHSLASEQQGYWELVPIERLWTWVDADIEKRSRLLATFVPRQLSDKGPGHVTYELLRRYGSREDVRRALVAHFVTGTWWGKASNHFAGMRDDAKAWRLIAKDAPVLKWILEYEQHLDREVERARVLEERERF